jgi:hypothetical protein
MILFGVVAENFSAKVKDMVGSNEGPVKGFRSRTYLRSKSDLKEYGLHKRTTKGSEVG